MPPLVLNAAMLSCMMGLGPPVPLAAVPKRGPGDRRRAADGDHRRHDPDGEHPNVRNVQLAHEPGRDLGDVGRSGCPHANALHTGPPGPWTAGSAKVVLGGVPVLTAGSTCLCAWLGTITIGMPGQATGNANG